MYFYSARALSHQLRFPTHASVSMQPETPVLVQPPTYDAAPRFITLVLLILDPQVHIFATYRCLLPSRSVEQLRSWSNEARLLTTTSYNLHQPQHT